jgi:hypothetical protein
MVKVEKTIPQRLKPPYHFAGLGGTTKQLAEKCCLRKKNIPRGLKPALILQRLRHD